MPVDTVAHKKYLVALGMGLIGSLLAWPVLFRMQAGALTEETMFVHDISVFKYQRAAALTCPKIVFIGGSGVLFSVRAAQIEQATHIPTANLGTHAALSLRYMLFRSRDILRPGDIAVLIPEYSLYYESTVPTDLLLNYAY